MDFIRNLFSRKEKTGVTGKDTVAVPNIWGSGDGQPFVLPRNPDVSAVFAALSTPELNVLEGAYLRHPDPNVRLATITEIKKLERYHLQSQELVDLLADTSSSVRNAAAQAIWLDHKAVAKALRCLRDEIHRTGFKSTMSSEDARSCLETLRQTAPSADDLAQFEEWVADIIGAYYSKAENPSRQYTQNERTHIENLIIEHRDKEQMLKPTQQNLDDKRLLCGVCGSTIQHIFSDPIAEQILGEYIVKSFSGEGSPEEYTGMMRSLGGTCPNCGEISCADCYGKNGHKCAKCEGKIPQLAG